MQKIKFNQSLFKLNVSINKLLPHPNQTLNQTLIITIATILLNLPLGSSQST